MHNYLFSLPTLNLLTFLISPHPSLATPSLEQALSRSHSALSTLQTWYNPDSGLWNTCGWWNSANCLTIIANLALTDQDSRTAALVERVARNTFGQAPAGNPQPGVEDGDADLQTLEEEDSRYDKVIEPGTGYIRTIYGGRWSDPNDVYESGVIGPQKVISAEAAVNVSQWLDGFYDDDAWWALAWIAVYDLTGEPNYLLLATEIFTALTKAWPTNCGDGGIWWSWKKDYANAIANELFLSLAAHLANRVSEDQKDFYVEWAERELQWFLDSGMINEEGTINDGLTEDCENNGFTAWSYNQGVILSALVELDIASPSPSYLALATSIAKAAIAELSDEDGVLHDQCGPNCGGDASQFKGIFVRGLQKLHEAAPDPDFVDTIQINAESIWENDRDRRGRLSTDWAGPIVPGANASTHSSAMEALIASIVVR